MKELKYRAALLTCALIWGCAFVAQSSAMAHVGPLTFTCIRSFIAAAVLAAMMPFFPSGHKVEPRRLWKGGVITGVLLCLGASTQQIGIQYTTVAKAGFLSALYVIIVPFLSVFLRQKVRKTVWAAAVIALAGLYILSAAGGSGFAYGDLMIILCAFIYSLHIMAIGRWSPGLDGIRYSCVQFLTAGILCLVPALLTEEISLAAVLQAKTEILYAGVLSSGAAYTLQIYGQKHTEPSVASLLLSLESVFAAIFGFLLLHQTMELREVLGCAMIFAAIVLAEYRPKRKDTVS